MASPSARIGEGDGYLYKIRHLVLNDSVALGKWATLVDHLLANSNASDVLKIKGLLRDYNYQEAVLQTLQIWQASGAGQGKLMQVLGAEGLGALAGRHRF